MPPHHLILIAILIGDLLLIGWLLARLRNGFGLTLGLATLVGGLGWWLPQRPELIAALAPFSDVVYYTNFYPYAVALFCPAALRLARGRLHGCRIAVLCAIMLGVSLYPSRRFWEAPPEFRRRMGLDRNAICLQASPATCGAASIVTLLDRFGIKTNEWVTARLALSRRAGTDLLGQYRALKILTQTRDDLHVRLLRMNTSTLLKCDWPAVIPVGLRHSPRNPLERELAEQQGWRPGVLHNVVFLGRDHSDPSQVLIGDPTFGLERWPVAHLEILFQEYAILIEQRQPPRQHHQTLFTITVTNTDALAHAVLQRT